MVKRLKIITFNANGIRSATRKGFFEWFKSQNADFLCIQETKAHLNQLKDYECFPSGYCYSYVNAAKKGYSGVAIYAKKKPKKIIDKIGIKWADEEGRYIQFDYEKMSIISIYVPSGSSSDIRQKYKMDFLNHYYNILRQQAQIKKKLIICGDINIVHKKIDIRNWNQNKNHSGVLPEERAWLDQIFYDLNWIDAFREINKNPYNYTWWSNRGEARKKNVGWRIDYQILSPTMKDTVISGEIYKQQWFSDHAPLIMTYMLDKSV